MIVRRELLWQAHTLSPSTDIVKANTDRMSAMYFCKSIKWLHQQFSTAPNQSTTYRSWVIQSVRTYLELRLLHRFEIGLQSSKVWAEEFQWLWNRSHRACGRANLLPEIDRFWWQRRGLRTSRWLHRTARAAGALNYPFSDTAKLLTLHTFIGKGIMKTLNNLHKDNRLKPPTSITLTLAPPLELTCPWGHATLDLNRADLRSEQYLMLSSASFCTPGSASCARTT
jgi:hypothetical protein